MPRPPAFETAAARGAPEARAMPAKRTGCWILRRVQRGVWRDMLAKLEVCCSAMRGRYIVDFNGRINSAWIAKITTRFMSWNLCRYLGTSYGGWGIYNFDGRG